MDNLKDTRPLLNAELLEKYFDLHDKELKTTKLKERVIIEHQNYEKQFALIDLLLKKVNPSTGSLKLLDIGCGIGSLLYRSKIKGFKPYGIEPSLEQVNLTYQYLSKNDLHIINATGEDIPFADGSFDCIVSISVLEHCKNIEKFLTESIRVLKKNGYFYLVFPNYNFIWEPHYGLFWPPFLPKAFKRIYLSFLGRDPGFIDKLNFTKPRPVRKVLEKMDVELEDLSGEIFLERLTNADKIGVPIISKIVKKLNLQKNNDKLKWLYGIGLYFPVIWLIRKN